MQYNDGIPDGSRLAVEQEEQFKRKIVFLKSPEGQKWIETIRKLTDFAEKGSRSLPFTLSFLSPPRFLLPGLGHPAFHFYITAADTPNARV